MVGWIMAVFLAGGLIGAMLDRVYIFLWLRKERREGRL